MGHRILNNERPYTLRVRQSHAEPDGTAIILHVERVMR